MLGDIQRVNWEGINSFNNTTETSVQDEASLSIKSSFRETEILTHPRVWTTHFRSVKVIQFWIDPQPHTIV